MRWLVFLYGIFSYVLFLAVFLYAIVFIGGIQNVAGFEMPSTLAGGTAAEWSTALMINIALLAVFAIQHTVMARPAFKARWTQIIPEAAERSTFVMVTNLLFIVLFWQWRPMPELVWSVDGGMATALWALFWFGWLIVFLSTFMIDHFDLFGVRQVAMHLQGKEYTRPPYVERFFYRFVRHPLMFGFVIAFWAAPEMSQGRLLFAVMTTGYVLVGLHIEERDLVLAHGDSYRDYQKRVPMLLPLPKIGKN